VSVPNHKTLRPGTLRTILQEAQLTVEKLLEILGSPVQSSLDSSDTSKFYINLGNTTEYKILWGRELTVGCPVVVSPLPREWS
jgi:hypothetical protein